VGFLIDSSVIVASERGQLRTTDLRERLATEPAALAAITVSELLHGVHRADTTARRKRRAEFVEALLEKVAVLPFDLAVARTHAAIWADLARAGSPIGAHDLQIAATALTFKLTVATRTEREFRRVDGLAVDVW
jgi:predicted nucleic acid-binding protein